MKAHSHVDHVVIVDWTDVTVVSPLAPPPVAVVSARSIMTICTADE